jgi:hypothetical protein
MFRMLGVGTALKVLAEMLPQQQAPAGHSTAHNLQPLETAN